MIELGVVLAIVVGYLRGGSLSRLDTIRIRFDYLIIIALFIQVGLVFFGASLPMPAVSNFALLLATYALLIFASFINGKENNFLLLIAIGATLNFVVIALNGGMPVSAKSAAFIGEDLSAFKKSFLTDYKHVILTAKTRLPFLADIIPIPKPYPLPSLISAGDVFITIGAFLYLQNCMVYRGKRRSTVNGSFRQ
ncbi:MAG: hypothetical protein C4562_03575 [Actinobacteria bacterium]|nr:MAG: hypothetical protein C4562_03575 [Actinomycetota bacterium]